MMSRKANKMKMKGKNKKRKKSNGSNSTSQAEPLKTIAHPIYYPRPLAASTAVSHDSVSFKLENLL